jgi:Domain of unknown function (DUF4105)
MRMDRHSDSLTKAVSSTSVPDWKLRTALTAGVILLLGWGAMALWFQRPGGWPLTTPALVVWIVAGGVGVRGVWRWQRRALVVFFAAVVALFAWWQTVQPLQQRAWADDVARVLQARVTGDRVVLDNVRDFDWRSDRDYTARWQRREYDLNHLASADLILSYWMGPSIAHTLVSFGFDDGRHVVFSLEIRKERGEAFSAVGGFFRDFEQVLIAAEERDIVYVRSNVRGEDVYLYRLNIPKPRLRLLFLEYVDAANALERTPRFYNTLTSNCTTVVFDLARRLRPGLPLDRRLLLSGYFAEYAFDVGGLTPGYDFPTLQQRGRITQRALEAGPAAAFSTRIRRGVPGVPAREQR